MDQFNDFKRVLDSLKTVKKEKSSKVNRPFDVK